MKVLVTGGAGFIGSHTVDLLLQRGYQVRVLDNLQPRVHPFGKPKYIPEEVEFQIGDVSSPKDMEEALRGVDYVMHLAAYQDYLTDFSNFIHTNTESSALLFEIIVQERLPVRKIVFASSQSVSGEGKYQCIEHGTIKPEPRSLEQLRKADWEIHCPSCNKIMEPLLIDEDTIRPHTSYAISKYAIELLAERLGKRYSLPTVCLRYTYVQGSRNSFYNAYSGICRRFALLLLNGRAPTCYEDGQQLRDYINVADVARANVLVMEDSRADSMVFNVGGGQAITVLDFAKLMLKAYGSTLEPTIGGEFRLGDTRHTVSDISKLRELGWSPTIPVEQNIREYLDWIQQYRDTNQFLEEAERIMRQQGVVQKVASFQGQTQ
jgi:dTDP-L-rhamnose 4-epimerase